METPNVSENEVGANGAATSEAAPRKSRKGVKRLTVDEIAARGQAMIARAEAKRKADAEKAQQEIDTQISRAVEKAANALQHLRTVASDGGVAAFATRAEAALRALEA